MHDPHDLTARERQVLHLLRRDYTNEQIALRLGITLDGAKYHVSQILSKLGVSTRDEAAAAALAEQRPWWLRAAVWAKITGAATVAAAVVGLAVLAWGVVRTSEGDEELSPSEGLTGSPNSTPTALSTPADTAAVPEGTSRFDGVTMTFDYPEDWFIASSHFNEGRGDENVVPQSFDSASLIATEGIPPGAIKMDFGSSPLSVSSTPIIEGGYEELVIDNPSGVRFLLRRLEEGPWHIWGISEFGGYFFVVSVLMNTEGPALEAVEPTLTSWQLRLPE